MASAQEKLEERAYGRERGAIWMKEFNVTGLCIPEKYFMVDISDKVKKIVEMVDKWAYFTINRQRQFGKTATFNQLVEAGWI